MMAKKAEPTVWLSNAMMNSKIYSIRANFIGDQFATFDDWKAYTKKKEDKTLSDEEKSAYLTKLDYNIELLDTIWAFEAVPESVMPQAAFFEFRAEEKKKLPPLFRIISGYIVVHNDIAEILKAHNLGQTQMSPITLYDHKAETCLYEEHQFLNIAEHRRYFIPEHSEGDFTMLPGGNRHDMIDEDKIYAVSTDAMASDVDLWHDPYLSDSIFLSPRLHQALKAEKLDKAWKLEKPCKLVDEQADMSLPIQPI